LLADRKCHLLSPEKACCVRARGGLLWFGWLAADFIAEGKTSYDISTFALKRDYASKGHQDGHERNHAWFSPRNHAFLQPFLISSS